MTNATFRVGSTLVVIGALVLAGVGLARVFNVAAAIGVLAWSLPGRRRVFFRNLMLGEVAVAATSLLGLLVLPGFLLNLAIALLVAGFAWTFEPRML